MFQSEKSVDPAACRSLIRKHGRGRAPVLVGNDTERGMTGVPDMDIGDGSARVRILSAITAALVRAWIASGSAAATCRPTTTWRG